jgi:hypothetical protein
VRIVGKPYAQGRSNGTPILEAEGRTSLPSSEIQGDDQSGCVSVLSSCPRPNEGRYRPKFNSKSLRTP